MTEASVCGGDDDLQERHLLHRGEEVEADHVLGARGGLGEGGDGDGGGVGAQRRCRCPRRPRRSRRTRCLRSTSSKTASTTRSALPKPVYSAVPSSRSVRAVTSCSGRRRRRARFARLARAVRSPLADRLRGDVLQAHALAALGGDHGDAGAHEARADHGQALHLARPRALGELGVVLGGGGGQEDVDEAARLGGDGELAEGPRLQLEPLARAGGRSPVSTTSRMRSGAG